jgi:hypothetical protein
MLLGARTAIAAAVDEFFNRVTLLLPGNGTNGAQNNTFLDSSTNNFTITRNGNTTQGTFSPFSQTGWSNFFNGSGDLLNGGNNSALNISGGDFTVEAWIYLSALPSPNLDGNRVSTIIQYGTTTTNQGYEFLVDLTNNQISFASIGTNNRVVASFTFAIGTWYHIACTRASSTDRLFVNGTSLTLITNTFPNNSSASGTLRIASGRLFVNYNHDFPGYISNMRVTKGGALYTANFTPSTTPLTTTVSAGTVSLLTCQSNRFIDNSTNAITFTPNGTPSVQPFSPFAPTAAYSAATVGGSGFFDGTGDFMTVANNAAFNFGSGEFCVETWAYILPAATSEGLVCMANIGTGAGSWMLWLNASNQIAFYVTTGGSVATKTDLAQSSVRPENCWTHIVVCRSGTTLSLFVNGSRAATATYSSTIFNNTTDALTIGAAVGGGNDIPAYLSGTRIIKGSSPYDATQTTLTVPTAPATNVTNTSILLNYTNAGITDATADNVLETLGNAQISTTQSKFGGSSMYFDGNGDYLLLPARPLLNVSGGRQFTIECWVYTSSTARQNICIDTASAQYWDLCIDNLKINFRYNNAGVSITTSASITSGAWNHVAVCWTGSAMRIFINGTMDSANSTTSMTSHGDAITILGYSNYAPVPQWMNGYIDDFRITNGLARYTGNFTAPTAAFPTQ